MARKKDAAPIAQPEPAQVNASAAAAGETNGSAAKPNDAPRKPDQAFAIWSDRTTRLQVAIWENEVRYDDKVSLQHSVVLTRSFKNAEGNWTDSGSYRTHDLPLVRVLLELAHAWCAKRRVEDSSIPF